MSTARAAPVPARALGAVAATVLTLAACAGDPTGGTSIAIPGRPDLAAVAYQARIRAGLSGEITVAVPPGTGSIFIEVRGATGIFYLAKLSGPDGRDLVEGGTVVTRDAREVPGLVDWLHPNRPAVAVVPGEYRLMVRGETAGGGRLEDEAIEILIYTKAEVGASCGLRLDFLVAREAVVEYELAIDGVVERLVPLFDPVGIGIIDYQIQQISVPAPEVDVSGQSWSATLSLVDEVLRRARAEGSAREDSLHVIVVRSLAGFSEIAGYSMGLPGPYAADRPTAAVLVPSESWVDEAGYLDLDAVTTIVAHEMGHYLGLYHTSESGGLLHDPIDDTPECSGSYCADDSTFTENVMTPDEGARRHLLTPGQASIIKRHPLCRP